MESLKQKSLALNIFGAYLIVAGLVGYLSNPEKAKTALISGGVFGVLLLISGFLVSKKKLWAAHIGLGLCILLSVTFSWRAFVGWMAVYGGNNEKLFAAVLISSMLVGALLTIRTLMRKAKSSSSV